MVLQIVYIRSTFKCVLILASKLEIAKISTECM